MSKSDLPAVSDEQLSQALATTVEEAGGVRSAGLQFLGFSGKQGVYRLGKNKGDVDEDRLFLVEPAATIAGWTCWKDSKPVGKHKWLSLDAARNPDVVVSEGELYDHGPYRENSGDGWKEMVGIGLVEMSDMGTSIEFSSTAVSAINGLKYLIQEVSDRLARGEPAMPIIWLGREQFTARGSTNWKPTFNVESWVTREAVIAFVEGSLPLRDLLAGDAPKAPRKRSTAKKRSTANKL